MHICRVTRAFVPLRDGISHHAYYLSKYQASSGHKVWVLQPHHHMDQVDGFRVEHISLGPLRPRYGDESVTGLFTILAGVKAIRLHLQHQLDIIHGHGDIVEALILNRFARLLGIPLTMTIHSGLSRHHRYRGVAPWIWRKVDGIITVSQETATDLEALGVRSDKVAAISSGVELEQFTLPSIDSRRLARQQLGIPDSVFVIVAVGNLNTMKGFYYLIEAVQLSQLNHLRVYIIGDGPLRSKFRSLVSHVPPVQIVGSVPHDQVRGYLHAADLFVLPSVDLHGKAEGTPTAVMEAMAAGLPVITTDSGGAKDLIATVDGCNVVPQRDSRALARAIQELHKNEAMRGQLGHLNWERVQKCDWSHIAAAVCEVYRNAGVTAA